MVGEARDALRSMWMKVRLLNGLYATTLATVMASAMLVPAGSAALLAQAASRSFSADDLPELAVMGDVDPTLRKAQAIVNGDVITDTDIDQRLGLVLAANGGKIDDAEKQRLRLQIIRNLIDEKLQLQEALESFERRKGVVASITNEDGSKSGKLAAALNGDKKVVVCTIQTFPFALEEVRKLAATGGKRFAVIADEAHSSQTGAAADKLKQVLSAAEAAELADGGEVDLETLLAAQMANRASESGITYVAFTATPKAKTLELFGRRPNCAFSPGHSAISSRWRDC